MSELDDIGSETANMMRTMLQMATLVALKSRERGQKDAELRAKAMDAKIKEAREQQIREARDFKSKDPRNAELGRMMSGPTLGPATKAKEGQVREGQGIKLGKDPNSPFASGGGTAVQTAEPAVRYDSAERRAAVAQHLERAGVSPELAEVRRLMEMGHSGPIDEAAKAREAAIRSATTRGRGIDGRGQERGR